MEPKNKIHLVSMTTPIRLGVVTTVDLGDTSLSQSQVPIAHAQLEQLVEDIFPMPPAGHSQHVPMVDLRSLRFKQDMISREHLKFAKDRGASTKKEIGQNRQSDTTEVCQPVPGQPDASCSTSKGPKSIASSIVSDEGLKVIRHQASIRRTGMATRWYTVVNTTAIEEPPTLHSTTGLELGDLFLNKYSSASKGVDVLQVWLLLAIDPREGEGYYWSQVFGEAEHPKLPGFFLAFQPSDLNCPSWVQHVTKRRRRERPQILAPGEGTFVESVTRRGD